MKLSLIGLVAGLVLGGAVSAGAEMVDDRLYCEEDLAEMGSVDVISEIPSIATDAEEKKKQKIAVLGWATTALGFAMILAGFVVSYLVG